MRPLLKTAAKLRAQGRYWQEIADEIGRSISTVKNWPSQFPELWQPMYDQAILEVIGEAESKALSTQLEMLEYKDGDNIDLIRVAQSAAHSLLNHSSKLRAQHISMTTMGEGGGLQINLVEAQRPEKAKAKRAPKGAGKETKHGS